MVGQLLAPGRMRLHPPACLPAPSQLLAALAWPQALELLSGTWRLVYTSNSEVLALLGLARLPFVTVEDITQTVDGAAMSVENKVGVSG